MLDENRSRIRPAEYHRLLGDGSKANVDSELLYNVRSKLGKVSSN